MADTRPIAARERVNFSKIRTAIQIPNLIEVQKNSYERFLQMNMLPEEREDTGLQAVFNSVFPISDFRGVSTLEYISYSIGNWRISVAPLASLQNATRPPAAGAGAGPRPQRSSAATDAPATRRRPAARSASAQLTSPGRR